MLQYFKDQPSKFMMRSGAELGDESEISTALSLKLVQELEGLMKEPNESVHKFLMAIVKKQPEQLPSILEDRAGPPSFAFVRGVRDFVAGPLATLEEEAQEDGSAIYPVYFKSDGHAAQLHIEPDESCDGKEMWADTQGSAALTTGCGNARVEGDGTPLTKSLDEPVDILAPHVVLSDDPAVPGAGPIRHTTPFEDEKCDQAASWFSSPSSGAAAPPPPFNWPTSPGSSSFADEPWALELERADEGLLAEGSAGFVPWRDPAVGATPGEPTPICAVDLGTGPAVVAADSCAAGAPVPRRHPKDTKNHKKLTVGPEEGLGGNSTAQPAPKRARLDSPDKHSGRSMCAIPGHGSGEREARGCKSCAVLYVDECAAQVKRPPGMPAAEWAFAVLQRVARTPSTTYWCPQCLEEALLNCPERRAGLVEEVRRAEAAEGGEVQRRTLKKVLAGLFRQTTKCALPAHVLARNGGFCRCPGKPKIWRDCEACLETRAHPYAGLK